MMNENDGLKNGPGQDASALDSGNNHVDRLSNDIARCAGYGSVEDGVQHWREGCENCLRRTAPKPERAVWMTPPAILVFECEYRIPPSSEKL